MYSGLRVRRSSEVLSGVPILALDLAKNQSRVAHSADEGREVQPRGLASRSLHFSTEVVPEGVHEWNLLWYSLIDGTANWKGVKGAGLAPPICSLKFRL
jgi:hypothetical protein